ncbi:MAG: D-alanine--D-alanine ligase [Leptospiraceae bacterium]|nr:D-alanine--D-alanine ligase [Leptospiraceae bacterium]
MTNIAVIFGGDSSEHPISIKTGNFIYNTLDRSKYKLKPIFITKKGTWLIPKEFNTVLPTPDKEKDPSENFEREFRELLNPNELPIPFDNMDCEVCVLGLHGGKGDNGTIQSLLKLLKLKFTGSDVLASSLAMDKAKSNFIFSSIGLNVAEFQLVTSEDFFNKSFQLDSSLHYPIFVKPNEGGSSVATGMARNDSELNLKLEQVFKEENTAIIQNLVKGTEVSCGVVEYPESGKFIPTPLFPTEIIPDSEFFDFTSKYTSGKSNEITPARLEDSVIQEIRNMAVKAHTALGCRGYSRTDFIIKENKPFILETNTLPGMTETSLIPQQVKHLKQNMKDILDILIQNAIKNIHV